MTPRLVRALVALAALVPALSVSSSGAAERFTVQEIVRTGTRWTGDTTIRINVTSDDDRGLMALVGVQRRGRTQNLAFIGVAEVGTTPSPTIYGTGMPGCTAPVACTFKAPATGEYRTVVGNFKDMRYFVVSEKAKATITLDQPGWKVRPARLGVRRILAEDAGTGARTYRHGVEEFDGASAPGGKYGSAVLAVIPCSIAGSGSATLTGAGGSVIPLRCSDPEKAATAGTSRATTWQVEGLVRGVGDTVTRLLVVDFPKP